MSDVFFQISYVGSQEEFVQVGIIFLYCAPCEFNKGFEGKLVYFWSVNKNGAQPNGDYQENTSVSGSCGGNGNYLSVKGDM